MKEELLKELKDAMKNKDELRKNTITMLRSAILQVEKDTQKSLTDDEIIVIISKEVKKRKDSISDYEKAERFDIVNDLNKEIDILSKYLPKQLTEEEIYSLVDEAVLECKATSFKDMGKVMQILKPKTVGKADGKLVSQIVKEKLENM
jgi:hypothetical protein